MLLGRVRLGSELLVYLSSHRVEHRIAEIVILIQRMCDNSLPQVVRRHRDEFRITSCGNGVGTRQVVMRVASGLMQQVRKIEQPARHGLTFFGRGGQ